MKCKICYQVRTESHSELAEHMLSAHADYFADRPEAAEIWRGYIKGQGYTSGHPWQYDVERD